MIIHWLLYNSPAHRKAKAPQLRGLVSMVISPMPQKYA